MLRCFDHGRGQPVALKMIRSKRRFQKQAAIEAGILAVLKEKVRGGMGSGCAVGWVLKEKVRVEVGCAVV